MILMANDIKTFAQTALSLSIEQCLEMALQHNEALQQADNELKQAELDKAIAFTAYLTKFEGTATVANVFEDIDMMGMELRMKGMYMAGISLIQPIYAGGKIMAGRIRLYAPRPGAFPMGSLLRADSELHHPGGGGEGERPGPPLRPGRRHHCPYCCGGCK